MNSAATMSLRPTGIGRYFVAAFMAMWLVGWLVGEVFAIAIAGAIFSSVAGAFPDRLPAWSADLVASSGLAFALLFLLVWLTFWTFGGIAALLHLMRSLVGEDVIGLTDSGFELVRRAGPFRRRYAFDSIRDSSSPAPPARQSCRGRYRKGSACDHDVRAASRTGRGCRLAEPTPRIVRR